MTTAKIRVLVVEDDRLGVTSILYGLHSFDFETAVAGDGMVALAVIESFKPDVIMLDLLMPVHDGFEFMRNYEGSIPVIVTSAFGDEDTLPARLAKKPYGIVMKPFSMEHELVPMLRAAAKGETR